MYFNTQTPLLCFPLDDIVGLFSSHPLAGTSHLLSLPTSDKYISRQRTVVAYIRIFYLYICCTLSAHIPKGQLTMRLLSASSFAQTIAMTMLLVIVTAASPAKNMRERSPGDPVRI